MKEELINKLLNEFEKDKEVIKKNLLMAMDEIMLQASNEYEKITMIIKIERKNENENNK